MVAQISRRKPVLNKPLSNEGIAEDAAPDSALAHHRQGSETL
jgi:hypothetical protein